VEAVWDLGRAWREVTPTRERVCLNGLWRWQPASGESETVPEGEWGHFKVPGCWPGRQDWLQKDCQTVFLHPDWAGADLAALNRAWYEREVTVPGAWAGRRITLSAEYVNSYAIVCLDGAKVGELRYPADELDLTAACRPGGTHRLSLLVVAMPLQGVMLSYNDTASARQVQGNVERRGLCGDVFLCSAAAGPQVQDVRVDTSVEERQVTFGAALGDLAAGATYRLQVRVAEGDRAVKALSSEPFTAQDLKDGWFEFAADWLPDKLWDLHTPQNQYEVTVSLLDAAGQAVDVAYPRRTGFREFRIEGRDFMLNGTRVFLSGVPLDNAQVGAAWASYAGARESLERLKSFGINFVYAHNYGCEPGSHLGFEEALRAADDVGVLVALSQPHFGHYDWKAEDADQSNGYAAHAAFYTRVAGAHASVIAYSTSHNSTGYSEDMNPDLIDGVNDPRDEWSWNNVRLALRAEAIISRLDPHRFVYHHSSGNLSSMHTTNFYTNFAPIQELSDWFEHWATEGAKPVFTCEYMVPCTWDWTMYRGWYRGQREFGSAVVPWEFCVAEWNSQFLGDGAFRISEPEKANLRWEAEQFRAGQLWHRWDYPYEVGSERLTERYPVIAAYLTDNWRAFRTWGVSATSPWEWGHYWYPQEGVSRERRELPVDWANLQRPGFSADYIDQQYERIDLAFERDDWVVSPAAAALYRNNMPLLAYIAGEPGAFTSKDHDFRVGETVEKQLIIINNSRESVTAECEWTCALAEAQTGRRTVTVATGQQERIPIRVTLPEDLAASTYELSAEVRFSTGETQADAFLFSVLPAAPAVGPVGKVALFDPQGETRELLAEMGVSCQAVAADADLAEYEVLVIGKTALTAGGPAPDLARVREGLRVLVFEQTAEALEKRLGFRVAEYGLRQVFRRIPDSPALAGLEDEQLRDWRGEATLLPPRLQYDPSPRYAGSPTVRWCGLEQTRVWRCGNRGNVASVLIEKPACGDFLPLLDGGYSLQYSPLMEYREGSGLVLFCQMDVTGRTEGDPAAQTLVANILRHVAAWKPSPRREAVYAGDAAGREQLEAAGITPRPYDGELAPEQTLIVGPGGAAPAAPAFVKAGGHLLALGLSQDEANACLPSRVGMTPGEHIAAWFTPPSAASLLAGVGPAEVHNRAPRELSLVTSGAQVTGNGVLAQVAGTNAVLCQFAPQVISPAHGEMPSLVIDDADAYEGTQSALVTLGVISEAGVQFAQGVKFEPVAGKTYTFAAFVKALDRPVTLHLEVERAGRPWDRAVRAPDVEVPVGEWTEVHASFQCETAFPEGWQAYVASAQPGGRFRADAFRLYEGEHVPWSAEGGPENLLTNPGFEAGDQPWYFQFREQQNLRRTYRRASFMLSRILANMGVAGETPLLSRFGTPASGAAEPSVARNGDFALDADADGMPDEWQFSPSSPESACVREPLGEGHAVRMDLRSLGGQERVSVMLAQHGVPMRAGQWYRLSLKARSEGLDGGRVVVTVTNTKVWRALFDYQYFAPTTEWKTFRFLVQANDSVETDTRFQIWHEHLGSLWLADIALEPVPPPTEGRWTSGLYLDQAVEWDDPYRFFRW
jgi:hypothetical protein